LAVPRGAVALEQKLNTGSGSQVDPDIFGNTVVWADNSHGNWDIYYYDIPSEQEVRLTSNQADQEKPCIYGNYMVWQDNRNGDYDIYMNDPTTGQEIRITNNAHNQTSPDIYGPWIVWEDDRSGDYDIYMYDINTRKEMRLAGGPSNQKSPTIFGDTLVYLDNVDGDYEIFKGAIPPVFSIDTDLELPVDNDIGLTDGVISNLIDVDKITDDSVDQSPPQVWGFNIVWSDERSYNSDIFYFNIMTRQEMRLTSNPEDQRDPVIHSNTVLWADFRSGNGDIYKYDLLTKDEKKVMASGVNERSPAIYDTKIIFVADSQGDSDIFYMTLQKADDDSPDKFDSVSPENSAGDSSRGFPIKTIALIVLVIIIVIFALKSYISRRGDIEEDEYVPSLKEVHRLKKKDELVDMCNELGLNPYGNKKRLRKRLITYVTQKEQEKRERNVKRALVEAESRDAQLARREGYRRAMGLHKTGIPGANFGEIKIPRNFDFSSVELLWDNGLESTGILGLEEKFALGMLPNFYYEAFYDAWKEDYLNKYTLAGSMEAASPQPPKSEGRYAPKPAGESDDIRLDWDDGYDVFGLAR